MRIHVIIDPHDKIDNKMPSDFVSKWQISSSMFSLPGTELDSPNRAEKAIRSLVGALMKSEVMQGQ